jgi:hypothetical protein
MDEPTSGSNKTRQIPSVRVNHYAGACQAAKLKLLSVLNH